MAITIKCTCGQKLRANDTMVGKTVRCPKCGTPNIIPVADQDYSDEVSNDTPDSDFPDVSKTNPPAFIPSRLTPTQPQTGWKFKPALLLSGLAVLVSILTAVWVLIHDPLGAGVSSYDFTTPKRALDSQLRIKINQDIRAQLDLAFLQSGRFAEEKLSTIKIHKESIYQGKKLLFVSYKKNGIPQYDIEGFEKDAESGYWFPAYISAYGIDDLALKKAITDWKKKADADTE